MLPFRSLHPENDSHPDCDCANSEKRDAEGPQGRRLSQVQFPRSRFAFKFGRFEGSSLSESHQCTACSHAERSTDGEEYSAALNRRRTFNVAVEVFEFFFASRTVWVGCS